MFRRTNTNLLRIKAILEQIEVKPTFSHQWFRGVPYVSFWDFFNRFNLETEKKEQALNVKKFFVRYTPPLIHPTEQNLNQLRELETLTVDFTNCIRNSVGGCSCFSSKELLFGRNDQATLILK